MSRKRASERRPGGAPGAKRFLPFIIIIAVAGAAFGGGAWLYHTHRAAVLQKPLPQLDAAKGAGESLHAIGPEKAPVVVEEFGDFQCPPCGHISEPLNQIVKDYSKRLRFIFRNFPLETAHVHARQAALAAEAAAEQGRFWEMHDLLYREQAVWSKAPDIRPLFNSYAGLLHLDVGKFNRDFTNPEINARVTRDQDRGKAAEVKNTPTIFINGKMVDPKKLNPAGLRELIDVALGATPSTSPSASPTP